MRTLGYCPCGQVLLREDEKVWHPWYLRQCALSKQCPLTVEHFLPADDSAQFEHAYLDYRALRREAMGSLPPINLPPQRIEDFPPEYRDWTRTAAHEIFL